MEDTKKEIKLKDYKFFSRLDYFIKKSNFTRKDFYENFLSDEISERTYKSYFCHGKEHRNPKRKTIEIMAETLEISPWLLVPSEEDFKKHLNFWKRMTKLSDETIINENLETIIFDAEKEESYAIENFTWQYIDKKNGASNESRNIALLFLQYYIDNPQLNIDDRIIEILFYYGQLNEKGAKKFLEYTQLLICNFEYKETVFPYPKNIEELIDKYNFSVGGLNQEEKEGNVGSINIRQLKDQVELRKCEDITIGKLIAVLYDALPHGKDCINLILGCMFLDINLNSDIYKDILDSLSIIVQLFNLDDDFSEGD